MDDIGQGSQRIICFTSEMDCCSSTDLGRWVLPNDMVVPESSSGEDIFVARGSSIVGFTRLGDTDVESGLLRCEIPDAEGQTQRLYVGVYSSDLAQGMNISMTMKLWHIHNCLTSHCQSLLL